MKLGNKNTVKKHYSVKGIHKLTLIQVYKAHNRSLSNVCGTSGE